MAEIRLRLRQSCPVKGTLPSEDLTPSQATTIYVQLRPATHYLCKLQARMEQQFRPDDRLYLEVKTARNAMQLPTKDLHAIGCRFGTS